MASQGWWLRCGSSQVEVGMCVVWNVFGCVMGMIKGKERYVLCKCAEVPRVTKGETMECMDWLSFLWR